MTTGRLAGWLGLVPSAAVGTWWLAVEWLAVEHPGVSSLSEASDALEALWLCQLLCVVLFGPRLGAALGPRAAGSAFLMAIVIGWPLVALLWSATSLDARSALAAEAVLLASAYALPALGALLERTSRSDSGRDAIATLLSLGSTVCAALIWRSRDQWLAWLR